MTAAVAAASAAPALAGIASVEVKNTVATKVDGALRLSADIVLDDLRLKSNRQLYVTPIVEDTTGNSLVLPSVMVNGKAMQIAYERHSLGGDALKNHEVSEAVRRHNGKEQTVNYLASTPLQKWMYNPAASIRWTVDSCGCGALAGSQTGEASPLNLNPAGKLRVAYITPEVTELPVAIHEGKAEVKFELSKSVLHDEPYRCANGQLIDNRAELKIIDDSISYALADKNVEIAKIKICGYASPEGSYLNNQNLSTDRSRALSEYIARRYNLPKEKSEFDAVPENWQGFRRQVVESPLLSVTQRNDLLALIDRPVYGPSDYDQKEKELRTDPKFASLFKNTILPDWFPQLRATDFQIQTRLRPLSDEELAEVIKKSPEKMTLNQMFRVAKLYPEGSDDFDNAIETALKYFPEDPTANLNAAATALRHGNLDRAERLLEKAGDTPEAANARGILATWRGDLDDAARLFQSAGVLPEAAKNAEMVR